MSISTPASPNGGGLRQRLLRGTLLKWNEVDGYLDRDGVQPVEGPYLLWGMEQGYQRWKDQTLIDEIIDKPLPNLEELNGAIPKSEWEPGLDGHPRTPYSHQYCVYLLDPNDGQFFTLMNSTVGMRMLWESLAERWEVMRHLRGADVIAVVNLATRPFRTAKWGIKYRPDLRILEWRKLGRRWRRQIGWIGCSKTATATGTISTGGTAGADIDTGTSTSPDAGRIDFASRSACAATFG